MDNEPFRVAGRGVSIMDDVAVGDPIAYLNSYGMPDDVRDCEVCGLPTIVTLALTFCVTCHKLLCVTCQDGHAHNFGAPFGSEPIDF